MLSLKKPILNSRAAGLASPGGSSTGAKRLPALIGVLLLQYTIKGGCPKLLKHNPSPNIRDIFFTTVEWSRR